MEPRSIQKCIEKNDRNMNGTKTIKSRNKTLQPRGPERILGLGEVPPPRVAEPLGSTVGPPWPGPAV